MQEELIKLKIDYIFFFFFSLVFSYNTNKPLIHQTIKNGFELISMLYVLLLLPTIYFDDFVMRCYTRINKKYPIHWWLFYGYFVIFSMILCFLAGFLGIQLVYYFAMFVDQLYWEVFIRYEQAYGDLADLMLYLHIIAILYILIYGKRF